MAKFFKIMEIFKTNNPYNEKTILGFVSFGIMILTALLDLTAALLGINFSVKEYIYTSFVTVTLGSFGIAGIERFSGSAKIEARANRDADIIVAEEAPSNEPMGIPCPKCGFVIE